jgi:RNA recognition motif-containing protein
VIKNLYVGNLPHSTTEADLRSLFEAQGAVEKVKSGDRPGHGPISWFRFCRNDQCL